MDLYYNSLPELNLTEYDNSTYPTPEELDAFLAKGWYRMQENLFCVHYIAGKKHEEINTAIWLRVPLNSFKKSKSLRQISNRIESNFKVLSRKAVFDKKKARLYQKYVKNVRWRGDSIYAFEQPKFNTWEISVYDGPELIAFSFFDLGKKAISSIVGIYHPDYEKYSLGIYTMIGEIEYGIKNGFDYYYPGYFVIGNPDFDYKLRFKPSEFYRITTGQWHPISEFNENDDVIHDFQNKLTFVSTFLKSKNVENELIKLSYDAQYLLLDFPDYGRLLDHPYGVILSPYNPANIFNVVLYYPQKSKYALCTARHPISALDYFGFLNRDHLDDFVVLDNNEEDEWNFVLDKRALEVEEIIALADTPENLFLEILKLFPPR